MGYRFRRGESVEDGLRRIATGQIDKALAEVDDPDLDSHETVHQVRKRCKKLRGLVRLVRPVFPDYRRVNALFRDAAGELSFIRDAHAVIATLDNLLEHFDGVVEAQAFESIRRELIDRRDQTDADRESIERRLSAFRDTLAESRPDAECWVLKAGDGQAVAGGAGKTYRRARKAMADARDEPSTAVLHEWRKRVKYHWYHARLLANCWPKVIKPWATQVSRLADLLGDEHDLAVLHAMLLEHPGRYGDRKTLQAFTGLIERRRAELRASAFRLGSFVLFEKPKQLERRIRVYFDAWQAPAAELSAPPPADTD